MSLGQKLHTSTQRTLVNTDIMGVQDSAGAAWHKTTLAKLGEFLYFGFLAISNAWTAKQRFAAGIDMDSQKIENLANGTNSGDAVNKGQLDLMLPKTGGTMTGTIAMSSSKITGLGNGVNAQDAVTKSQLDAKQNTITGTTDSLMTYNGTTVISSILKQNKTINAFNIDVLTAAPSSSPDTIGNVGDIGWFGEYLYLKTNTGWVRKNFETF